MLLLLLSGNIHPNPGPELAQLQTPEELKSSNGIRFFHLNVRSLVNKLDAVRIWADSTDADIIILTETWLKKNQLQMIWCILMVIIFLELIVAKKEEGLQFILK